MMKLVPRHRAPTIHFQLTEAVPMLAAKGDHVLAWPEEGRLLIMTAEEVQVAYDVVLNGAGAKWTEHRRQRFFLLYRYDALVSAGEMATLVAPRRGLRARCLVPPAMVTGSRADLANSSADRVAADLGGLAAARLAERRQDPLQRARTYVWRCTDAGLTAIATHRAPAVAKVGSARRNGVGTDVSIPGTEQPECP